MVFLWVTKKGDGYSAGEEWVANPGNCRYTVDKFIGDCIHDYNLYFDKVESYNKGLIRIIQALNNIKKEGKRAKEIYNKLYKEKIYLIEEVIEGLDKYFKHDVEDGDVFGASLVCINDVFSGDMPASFRTKISIIRDLGIEVNTKKGKKDRKYYCYLTKDIVNELKEKRDIFRNKTENHTKKPLS